MLYEPRIKRTKALLEKEALAKEVDKIATHANDVVASNAIKALLLDNTGSLGDCLEVEEAKSETAQSKARATTILEEARNVRDQIGKMRGNIMRMRSEHTKRASALEPARDFLKLEVDKTMVALQEDISSTQGSWDRLHERAREARIFLCREAAALYRLEQRKKRKGVQGRDTYLIGGVPIIDLRDLNSKITALPSSRIRLSAY